MQMQASVDHYVDPAVDHRRKEAEELAEAVKRATPEIQEKVIAILKSRGYLK